MKSENKTKKQSDKPVAKKEPVHPGKFFEKHLLKNTGASTTEVAEKMDLPHEVVLAFCKGQQDVTTDIADRLVVVVQGCNLTAQDWIDMQTNFNDSKDAAKVATALDLAKEQFRDMNKVHEMGTIAEIAQKLGISKSEVRRRKANGTLVQPTEQ